MYMYLLDSAQPSIHMMPKLDEEFDNMKILEA